jgi:short-subunit dehydrogenase
MSDLILTGASRGIGQALAMQLATGKKYRLLLIARSTAKLDALAAQVRHKHTQVLHYVCDLSSVTEARALGERLASVVQPGATLVHNAGVWPTEKELTFEGNEVAFATNCIGPLALQKPLLDARLLSRVLVVGAGLMSKGKFSARTPKGEDFSAFRTYASTKLALAVAMRDVAKKHPELDVLVVHPGVIRTELGAREGLLGSMLSLVKRSFDTPRSCGERLERILERPRWTEPGHALWQLEEEQKPWPTVADDAKTRSAVLLATSSVT